MSTADPRHHDESRYDEARYEAVLEACGPGPFQSALELGGTVGAFTELLAPHCESLTTIDVSSTAAAMARRRLAGLPGVEVLHGAIPDAIPNRDYELIVVSGILEHLGSEDFERTLSAIRYVLVPHGRLIAIHWRPPDSERPVTGSHVHARLRDDPWLITIRGEQTPGYVLDVFERR